MKTSFAVVPILLLAIGSSAQTFKEALTQAYNQFEKTDSLPNKLDASNKLDLIAARWNDQWTAHYYVAYAKVVLSYLLNDEKQRDAIIDKAELSLTRTNELLGKTNDELLVMEAYIANARLAVKSGSRWKKYGAIFDEKLEEAKKINPDNPRIYLLKGQSLFYTPKAFGGGVKKALPQFEKAASLFEAETKNSIDKPSWGQRANSYYINECKK
jgi:hypothetical protein